MSMLSSKLLNPTLFQVYNPFFSLIKEVEDWLMINNIAYPDWPSVKYHYLTRILKLEKKGAKLRGFAQTAPTHALSTALLEIYNLIDNSVYFSSKYWRAFYYYLKTGSINTNCWPQFGMDEVNLATSLLTPSDLTILKEKAEIEWLDFYKDDKKISLLFKEIKKPLRNICYARTAFLNMYDPALYSFEDLLQYAYTEILVRLRNNDYIPSSTLKLRNWSLRCADNALHNLREKELAQKRTIIVSTKVEKDADVEYQNTLRVTSCNLDDDFNYFEVATDNYLVSLENRMFLNDLLKTATPNIKTYLKTIYGEEHNLTFWSWLYQTKPILAKKAEYLEENPEVVGKYLQQFLGISDYQLKSFLNQHIPELLKMEKKLC